MMRDCAALRAALAMLKIPALVRSARDVALPGGMMFLLEVSAGDESALKEAAEVLERPEKALRDAAGFFIEQILFTPNANSYRVLGARTDASPEDLRRHMALLLRWLHPDVAGSNQMDAGIDRSVFANRITLAWENLKTPERRGAYDLTLASEPSVGGSRPARGKGAKHGKSQHRGPSRLHGRGARHRRRFSASRRERSTFLSRMLVFFRGR